MEKVQTHTNKYEYRHPMTERNYFKKIKCERKLFKQCF